MLLRELSCPYLLEALFVVCMKAVRCCSMCSAVPLLRELKPSTSLEVWLASLCGVVLATGSRQ